MQSAKAGLFAVRWSMGKTRKETGIPRIGWGYAVSITVARSTVTCGDSQPDGGASW